MIGDFFTKPLGGAKFRRFRNIVMNYDRDDFGMVNMEGIMREHHQNIEVNDGRQNEPNKTQSMDTSGSQECVGTGSAHKWAKMEHAHQHHTYEGEILYVKREPHVHHDTAGITATTE